jgi:hypothetical protein
LELVKTVWDDLSADARDLLYESEIVLGGERHLKMLPKDWEGRTYRLVFTDTRGSFKNSQLATRGLCKRYKK